MTDCPGGQKYANKPKTSQRAARTQIITTKTGFFLGLLCSLFATKSCGSTLPPAINDENKPITPCEPVKWFKNTGRTLVGAEKAMPV